jgi:hypothetical protein
MCSMTSGGSTATTITPENFVLAAKFPKENLLGAKKLMSMLLRIPPKHHEDMKLGKRKSKKKKGPKKQK